jgi:uncharacterized protein YkwD
MALPIRSLLAVALVGAALSLLPAGGAAAATRSCGGDDVPTATTLVKARNATLCLVNRARTSHGLRPLRLDLNLHAATHAHARAMTTRLFFAREAPTQAIGWNVDYLAAPKYVVRRLLASRVERAKLLGRAYRTVGIGISPSTPVSPDRRGATYVIDVR